MGIIEDGLLSSGGGGSNKATKVFIQPAYAPTTGAVAAGDSVQDAIAKIEGQVSNLSKPEVYLGTYDALTNTPALPTAPTSPTYQSGMYYKVTVAGSFNGVYYTVGDRIVVALNANTQTLFWEKVNLDDEAKQEKIYTYTDTEANILAIVGSLNETAKATDSLKEFIHNGIEWLDNFDNNINFYSPRVFYEFSVDNANNVVFGNGSNVIDANSLLICTKGGTVGSRTYIKGYLYPINQTTNAPTDAMLGGGRSPAMYVNSWLLLERDMYDFEGNRVYLRGSYVANTTQTDWVDEISTKQDLGNGFVNTKFDSDIVVDEINRKISIKPKTGFADFVVRIQNKTYKIVKQLDLTFQNTEGKHYVFLDLDANGNPILQETLIPIDANFILTKCYVANFYWNQTAGTIGTLLFDERHSPINKAQHIEEHQAWGTKHIRGGLISPNVTGTGNLDADLQFLVNDGEISDDGFRHLYNSKAATDNLVLLYRENNALWRSHVTSNGHPVKLGVNGLPQVNINTAGVWSVQEMQNNKYAAVYIFAGNNYNQADRLFAVMGTKEYNNANEIKADITAYPDLGVLPLEEFKLLGVIAFHVNTAYTNASKAKFEAINGAAYIDFRRTTSSGVLTSSPSDIAALNNRVLAVEVGKADLAGAGNDTVAFFDNTGKLQDSQIHINELQTLANINGNIQTQLDGKADKLNPVVQDSLTLIDNANAVKFNVDSTLSSITLKDASSNDFFKVDANLGSVTIIDPINTTDTVELALGSGSFTNINGNITVEPEDIKKDGVSIITPLYSNTITGVVGDFEGQRIFITTTGNATGDILEEYIWSGGVARLIIDTNVINGKQDKIYTYTVQDNTALLAIIGMVNNETAFVIDEGKAYQYDFANSQWVAISGGGATINVQDTNTVDLTYNNITGTLSADVKDGSITDIKVASGISASKILNVPSGNIAATDLQNAINELDSEKVNQNTIAPSGNLSNINNLDSGVAVGNDGTNNTVPTSLQMNTTIDAKVTQGLLNVPSLPVVHFATTVNDTLTGLAARDGYTPTAGQFCLHKNATNGDQSVYITSSAAWTRAYYDTVNNIWAPITAAQVTYADLNINGGVVNVLNGTVNRNLQFQITVLKPSAALGTNTTAASPAVVVTTATKLPVRDIFNGWVSVNNGNNSTNNGTASFPYATIAQDLIGASYPHTTTLAASGSALSESLTLTAGNSNLTIEAQETATDAGKSQISGNVTLQTGNTRFTLKGITLSSGATTPIICQSGNALRHRFENVILTTTGSDLISLDPNVAAGFLILRNVNCDNSAAASIRLPNFTNPVTINIFNQNSRLPFTLLAGSTGANLTVNVFNSAIGAVRMPTGFTGTFNPNQDYINVNEIITTQARLTTVLADTTLNGLYVIDFDSPSSFSRGVIFVKQSASGFTENLLALPYGAINILFNTADGKCYTRKIVNSKNTWLEVGAGGDTYTVTNIATQALTANATAIVAPNTLTQDITITVAANLYTDGASAIKVINNSNFRLTIANYCIIEPNSTVEILPNSTSSWLPNNPNIKRITLKTAIAGLSDNMLIKITNQDATNKNLYEAILADGNNVNSILHAVFVLKVISATDIIIAERGNVSLFTALSFANQAILYLGTSVNGTAGTLVNTVPTSGVAAGACVDVIDSKQIRYNPPTASVFNVVPQGAADSFTVAKMYVVTNSRQTTGTTAAPNFLSLPTSTTLQIFADSTNPVRGRFRFSEQDLVTSTITLTAAQIPVGTNANSTLSTAVNINTVGIGTYVLCINTDKTIFAVPITSCREIAGLGDLTIDGQYCTLTNPVQTYRRISGVNLPYNFIKLGQVDWSGAAFSNVINYALNGIAYLQQAVATQAVPNRSQVFNHNLGINNRFIHSEIKLLAINAMPGQNSYQPGDIIDKIWIANYNGLTYPALAAKGTTTTERRNVIKLIYENNLIASAGDDVPNSFPGVTDTFSVDANAANLNFLATFIRTF